MIKFYKLIEDAISPMKASPCAFGTLPVHAYRYCEPVRTASSFGWYAFPPIRFCVVFKGTHFEWSLDDGETWRPLVDAIQYPGFLGRFNDAAPEDMFNYAPPFLSVTTTPGVLQIWTGLVAETQKDVSVLVKHPVNVWDTEDYRVLEGVIDTDWWFGPLFVNVLFRTEGEMTIFQNDRPLAQVQPFSRAFHAEAQKAKPEEVLGVDALDADAWEKYGKTVVHRMKNRERLGDYAVQARKNRS